MSLIESAGASALARGSPHNPQGGFAAKSGAAKANAIQNAVTAAAAAPVETARAVAQSQAAQKSRLRPEAQPVADRARDVPAKPADTPPRSARASPLSKPMTAVILHELRLQQELAHVQEEKEQKQP